MTDTMRSLFDRAIIMNRERVAVEYGDRSYTYDDIDRWSAAIARQLLDVGVRAGDTVSLYTRNHPGFLAADVAIGRLGAIKSPINYMLPADSVAYILGVNHAKAVIVSGSLAETTTASISDLSDAPVVLQLPEPGVDLVDGAAWLTDLPESPVEPLDYESLPVAAVSPAALYFTGGTTGRPKGVLHTQSSTAALHYAQLLEAEITQDERLLLMTPMAHAAGLFAQSAFIRGATSIITDGFDAERAVDLFASSRITWCFLVPTMIYRLIDVIGTRVGVDLAVRTIVYGAAPITPSRLAQALDLFGPVFIQLYGQTEMPNWGTRLTKSDHDPARPELLTSCGRSSVMADVQIADEIGRPLADGELGEIILRSPYILDRYLGDAKATTEKFLDGGWIRTGDIGVLEDGYLYLKDRKNDMVISGGMNVYSREVEDVLARHSAVASVAVIGVPHDDWGEAVHAFVVSKDASVTEDVLLAWCKEHLAAYSRPKTIEFVEALPETAFGKVDKKALRAPFWAGQTRSIG